MSSDYKEDNTTSETVPATSANYTTSLVNANNTTEDIAAIAIPTMVPTSSSDSNYWNYSTSWNETIGSNDNTTTLTGSNGAKVIPAHTVSELIRDDATMPTESSKTNIAINVNIDNGIPSGTYKNRLVFTAVANEIPPDIPLFWQINTMQEMTPEVCNSIDAPTTGLDVAAPTINLVDTRDSKTYTVAKLKDGNCWMISPLRLGTYGSSITLTPEDSNIQSNYTINSSEIINAAGPNWNYTPGTTHVFDRNNVTYGNWYNWYTATAGTGTPAMTDTDAPGSICPKGWKLPSYIGADSFQNLVDTYGATSFANIQKTPITFLPAGYYGSGAVDFVGARGYYWSASATSTASNVYYFVFSSGGVWPQGSNNKNGGFSVRCVASR